MLSRDTADRYVEALLIDERMMRSIKYGIQNAFHALWLVAGLLTYVATKKSAQKAHLAMIMLFCSTSGRSSDALTWIISLLHRPRTISPVNGLLPVGPHGEALAAVKALDEQGYYVFQNRLPDELCDRLLAFATHVPASTRLMDADQGTITKLIYDRERPLAVRYDFSTQDLVNNPDVQKILADLSFAHIAQEYLGSIPIVDVVAMWWHTKFSDRPDSEAAQFFHFDMDRPKWLKFFIYLTDVTTNNGPHFYVSGSHKTFGIPQQLLRKGYSRLSDDEIKSNYPPSRIIEFTAPRGTILAEDTRGLHKGKHVISGDRLMFQIQFSNSLFGATYPQTKFPENICDQLKASIQAYPEVYSAYS